MMRRPRRSTLFPSTTLFRSVCPCAGRAPVAATLNVVSALPSPQLTSTAQEFSPEPASLNEPRSNDLPVFSSARSEEHTSELQSPCNLVCRLLLEKKINQRDQ